MSFFAAWKMLKTKLIKAVLSPIDGGSKVKEIVQLVEVLGPWPTVVLLVGGAFAFVALYHVLFNGGR